MNKAISILIIIALNLIRAFNSYRTLNILQDFLDKFWVVSSFTSIEQWHFKVLVKFNIIVYGNCKVKLSFVHLNFTKSAKDYTLFLITYTIRVIQFAELRLVLGCTRWTIM